MEFVTRNGSGRTVNPLISPISVKGLFHEIGVDVLQLPPTQDGNQYILVNCGLPY